MTQADLPSNTQTLMYEIQNPPPAETFTYNRPELTVLSFVVAGENQHSIFTRQVYNAGMAKVCNAMDQYSDYIALDSEVGVNGRFYLKESGFPISTLYRFFIEGFSNEEVAEMLDGVSVEEVEQAHAFIDSLI